LNLYRSGLLELTSILSGDNEDCDNFTNTWAVSLARGDDCLLTVNLKNRGGSAISCPSPYVNDEILTNSGKTVAPSVLVWQASRLDTLADGASGRITFGVKAFIDAGPGTLPDTELDIK
jgi:hypothetical protein